MRFGKPMSMCTRASPAWVALLVATVVAAGCSLGRTEVSSTQVPNWPETPGKSPEETRATREAEIAMYRDPKYIKREPPAPTPNNNPSPEVERAPIGLGGDSAASHYGNLLFVSAQLPLDPMGTPLPSYARVDAQARLVLDNVRMVLEANELTMAHVISMTVYLKDLADLPEFDAVAAGYFEGMMPSRSVVEVTRLPFNAALQVSAVAGR